MARQRVQPGIYAYHSTGCRSRGGGRCSCKPTYTAEVYSKRDGRKLRSPSLPSLSEARSWRATRTTDCARAP
jgi:hypothetical protein